MQSYGHKTRHETMSVKGLDVFYRHAGNPDRQGILLKCAF